MTTRRMGGFTVVETLIAFAILQVAFLALAMMHIGALRANNIARNRTVATIMAYDTIERFQRLPFPSVVEGSDSATNDGAAFSRSWTTQTNAAGGKTVVVSVSWTGPWGTTQVSIPAGIRP